MVSVDGVLAGGYERLLRPAMFASFHGDPERIHEVMIDVLGAVPLAVLCPVGAVMGADHGAVTVAGIDFPNRVGVAAGLDKNGRAARAWWPLGFGHMELGTVTPRPQPGNPQPRLYRLRASKGLINRMGFNNEGVEALAARLRAWDVRRGERTLGAVIGVSIGKNRTTDLADAVDDYVTCLRALDGLADYVAVNVSSPNTPGLRSLQNAEQLRHIVSALAEEAARANQEPTPVFVKLAPDLSPEALDEAVDVCADAGASGLIATNTTLARDGLDPADQHLAEQAGGLSGAPLTGLARGVVERVCARTTLPVIGVGGIMKPGDATALFDAGASLVQVFTGFIYAGPALVRAIAREERP